MAFEGLQERLQGIFKKISGQGKLTEANMEEMLRDGLVSEENYRKIMRENAIRILKL